MRILKHTNIKTLFSLLGSFFIVISGHAQQNKAAQVQGTIRARNGQLLSNASISLSSKTIHQEIVADTNGFYRFVNIKAGKYFIQVTQTGYSPKDTTIQLNVGQELDWNPSLHALATELSTVTVQGKSKKTAILERAFAVDTRTTEAYKNTTRDVNQVLNQMTGVRIRQTGGLGSRFELSLNGLKDKQVRYFVDGIPVDQLGSAYQFNNLPVNLVERIDVYKGVVPVELGADALGGAINIISTTSTKSYLDASYSVGSFNTHRASLAAQHRFNETGITVKATGFYNFSDNNYRMQNMTVFENNVPVQKEITRFHDQYESFYGMVQAGFTKVDWADEFMIGIAGGAVKNDIQNGFFSRNAVGEAKATEENGTYSLHYKKRNLFIRKLDLDVYSLYNKVNSVSTDTSSNRYDWSGKVIRTVDDGFGELVREKTIFEFDQQQWLNRLYASYQIDSLHRINANIINTQISRQGENRLNKTDKEPFRSPNTLNQNVTGLEYIGNWLNGKLETIGSLKHYYFDISTKEAVVFANNSIELRDINRTQNNVGYAFAGRYFLLPNLFLKASYEKGYRLPQPREIFGDGLQIVANPQLKPESSHNFNISGNFTSTRNEHQVGIASNFFYRDVQNYILIEPIGLRSAYSNVLDVLVMGTELEISYRNAKGFSAILNGTWQKLMNNQRFFAGTTNPSSVYRDILPNTPYLFANCELRYQPKTILKKLHPTVFYTGQYIHEYYLYYAGISQSSTKNIIPTQFLNHIGISVADASKRCNLSAEINNVLDAKAYDNFMLQRPGRSFTLKLRYHISS